MVGMTENRNKKQNKYMAKNAIKRTKAEMILAAMRNQKNHGKTASEIVASAGVDHNHVYVMEQLVVNGMLQRNGGETRQLEGQGEFPKRRGGRGVTYLPGRNFPAKGTRISTKPAAVISSKKTKTKSTRKVAQAVAEDPATINATAILDVTR